MANIRMTRNTIWRTADGRDYQIRQMETSHILNCIRLIKRKLRIGLDGRILVWRGRYLPVLRDELGRRKWNLLVDRLDEEPEPSIDQIERHNEHGDHGDPDDGWRANRGHVEDGKGDFE